MKPIDTSANCTTAKLSALGGLSGRQLAVLCFLGLAFWFAGAIGAQLLTRFGMLGTVTSAASFAIAYPIAWAGVLIIARLARLGPNQIVHGIAVGTCVATSCDGIALTWARSLYGSDATQVVFSAGWVLWGIAPFFLAAFFEAYRRSER